MISSLVGALRVVTKRLVADWLLVTAAFVTIVLATVLLASGPIYADAVSLSALQRALVDAPAQESNLSVEIDVLPQFYELADRVVRATIDEELASTGAGVFAHIEADAYEFDDFSTEDLVALAALQHFESIETRATVTQGRWAGATAQPYETTVSVVTAETLGIAVGDVLGVTNRRDDTISASIRVVGFYEPSDPNDPFWFEDDLLVHGSIETPAFRTLGPLIVSRETMFQGLTPRRTNAGWRALPNYGNLTVPEVSELRRRVSNLEEELNERFLLEMGDNVSAGSVFRVETGLPRLLSDMERSLTVTRSSVMALLAQLAVLAGYALALTAGLLADVRRTETSLLRSRGASPSQVLAFSVLEGILLTAPAALAGPYVATLLLRTLNTTGPLAAIGLTIDPQPTTFSFVLAAIAAMLSVVALAWPAYRSARASHGGETRQQRQESRPPSQRAGLDIGLLVLAAAVFWQLGVVGPQISASVRGRFGVDPLLVLAPALGLLAGAALGLRVVPMLARLGEWVAAAGRATVAALASWQVARRPVRYARSSLLLMLAISIGFFAASYSTTWSTSQRDQAAHATGADIALRPNRAIGRSLTDIHLPSAHESIEGVTESMPILIQRGQLDLTDELAQAVILDAAKAASVVAIREDLAPEFGRLMDVLVANRPAIASVSLPGSPTAVAVDLEVFEELPEPVEPEEGEPEPSEPEHGFQGRLRLVLQDDDGALHRIVVGVIPVNEGPTVMELDLRPPVGDPTTAKPAYPLSLVNIEIESQVPSNFPRVVEVTFGGISVRGQDGTWKEVPVEMDWLTWGVEQTRVSGVFERPSIVTAPASSPEDLGLTIETGAGFLVPPVYFSIRPTGTELPATFPVVVSNSLIDSGDSEIGDEFRLTTLRAENDRVTVAGSIESFPTLDDGQGPVIIVDLPTLQMMDFEPGQQPKRPDDYWLAAETPDYETIATLEAPPFRTFQVESTQDLTDTLVSDPVALGTIGALTIGFVAAAVLAATGFAVSATVSARERLVEFALLRALGLSPRQLGSWLILEQGLLVMVSLGMGTLIGIVLTATILPLVTVTQDGSLAVPDVIVIYPWGTVLSLEVAVLAVLGVMVVVMSLLLRRIGLGSLLRLGED